MTDSNTPAHTSGFNERMRGQGIRWSITPILDEEDNTPVIEVISHLDGTATNLTSYEAAVRYIQEAEDDMAKQPRYFWDTETFEGGDQPYGEETARIVDLKAGGVIAYVHVDRANDFVKNLLANPIAE